MYLLKVPFSLVNLTFILLSASVLGFGIFLLADETLIDRILNFSNFHEIRKNAEMERNSTNSEKDPPLPPLHHKITDPISYLFISLGSLIFILSFIGFCGAVKNSRLLVALYGGLLSLTFLLEVASFATYFYYKPDLKAYLTQGLQEIYIAADLPFGRGAAFTIYMDFVMIENKCCGISGEEDFHEIYRKYTQETGKLYPGNDQLMPEACCRLNITGTEVTDFFSRLYSKSEDGNKVVFEIETEELITRKDLLEFAVDKDCIYKVDKIASYVGEGDGCFEKVHTDWSTILISCGVVLGILQICGIVFSVFIFRAAYFDYYY